MKRLLVFILLLISANCYAGINDTFTHEVFCDSCGEKVTRYWKVKVEQVDEDNWLQLNKGGTIVLLHEKLVMEHIYCEACMNGGMARYFSPYGDFENTHSIGIYKRVNYK